MPLTPEEFEAKYPLIMGWIQQTLATHAPRARTIASLGFRRLPHYFRTELLASAKVVYVDVVPTPPLSALGLSQFADFENMNARGITYLDTFFASDDAHADERLHFHELVHVLQWQMLGPRNFIAAYADGLERHGYRNSPLEVMAYTLDARFQTDPQPFDVASLVRQQLAAS